MTWYRHLGWSLGSLARNKSGARGQAQETGVWHVESNAYEAARRCAQRIDRQGTGEGVLDNADLRQEAHEGVRGDERLPRGVSRFDPVLLSCMPVPGRMDVMIGRELSAVSRFETADTDNNIREPQWAVTCEINPWKSISNRSVYFMRRRPAVLLQAATPCAEAAGYLLLTKL